MCVIYYCCPSALKCQPGCWLSCVIVWVSLKGTACSTHLCMRTVTSLLWRFSVYAVQFIFSLAATKSSEWLPWSMFLGKNAVMFRPFTVSKKTDVLFVFTWSLQRKNFMVRMCSEPEQMSWCVKSEGNLFIKWMLLLTYWLLNVCAVPLCGH